MLRIARLTYRVGGRLLFHEAEASIDPGHRVGLVGRNGSGKTTLLRLIAGVLEPEAGAIHLPPRWRIGLTQQEAPAGPHSLIETVLAADHELLRLTAEAETASDPHRIAEIHARLRDKDAHSAASRAARILAGLGFSEAAQQRPLDEYSGGWRMRVSLAALLFTEPDLLLLDEPTNHLDLEATLWLEDYLQRYPGTVILVSHDRDLLNRTVGDILHLEGAALTLYRGDFDRFEETRRLRLELGEKAQARQRAERARIQAFVDRFRYKASKARQAQSRLKMLERMRPLPDRILDADVDFDFPAPEPLASPLLVTEALAFGYDGRPVLKGVDLRLDADDRVALLGANGNGKSTLIKLLAGRLTPLSGRIIASGKLRIGYFAQHQTEELDPGATPVLELGRRRSHDSEQQLRGYLGRFGFTQERADTPVASLSGGEKARLLFALMSAAKPHLLLLDEPTNHLDIVAREALIQAINAFEGAVVLVSHDPHVIELTVDRLWLVDSGRVRPFEGDLDAYRAMVLRPRGGEEGGSRSDAPDRNGRDRRELRRLAAERRQVLAPLKKDLASAEATVHRLGAERTQVLEQLHDPAIYAGDGSRLIALQKHLGMLEKALQRAEERWLTLQDAWDQAHQAEIGDPR